MCHICKGNYVLVNTEEARRGLTMPSILSSTWTVPIVGRCYSFGDPTVLCFPAAPKESSWEYSIEKGSKNCNTAVLKKWAPTGMVHPILG